MDRARLNSILEQLASAGKRVTPQREAVIAMMLQHGNHPTALEVRDMVQRTHPSISTATVYNTLTVLEALGLVRPLHIAGDEHVHYDLDVAQHVNVVCVRCGQIADVHTDSLEALLGLVASRSGYQLAESDAVIVYGMCPRCRAQIS